MITCKSATQSNTVLHPPLTSLCRCRRSKAQMPFRSSTQSSAIHLASSPGQKSSLSRRTCLLFTIWRCPTRINTWKSIAQLMMNEDKNPCPKIGFFEYNLKPMNNDFKIGVFSPLSWTERRKFWRKRILCSGLLSVRYLTQKIIVTSNIEQKSRDLRSTCNAIPQRRWRPFRLAKILRGQSFRPCHVCLVICCLTVILF
jgi:hypothetical protein